MITGIKDIKENYVLTSSTSTTPIWGDERSMPKVFSQYGNICRGKEESKVK